jgi:hypothetical protein
MSQKKTQDRADRLKAALRDNLRRRKAQARGREASAEAERPGETLPPPGRKDGEAD